MFRISFLVLFAYVAIGHIPKAEANNSTVYLYNSCKSYLNNDFPSGYTCRDFAKGFFAGFIHGGIARKNPADRSRRDKTPFDMMLKEMGLCRFPNSDNELPDIFVREVDKDKSLLDKPYGLVFFIVIRRYGKC